MFDDQQDSGAGYRNVYAAIVETCGPPAPAPRPGARRDRAACRAHALKLLDVIEDGKMNTPAFVRARDAFATDCAPR
jgi:hypothetical protein